MREPFRFWISQEKNGSRGQPRDRPAPPAGDYRVQATGSFFTPRWKFDRRKDGWPA